MKDFYKNQDTNQQKLYIELLEITGSLSNLFAESNSPFIYYRAMENIFCKAFDADDYSRSDISADAGKDGIGIGLKTFLHNNGNTFQKIAEFNKESYVFEGLEDLELVKIISEMRNERINSTKRICDLDDMMYHLLTRSEGEMALYEEHMDLVDIDNIKLTKVGKTTIHFTDTIHFYNFNKSKSTLLKRFETKEKNKIINFPVKILEDPFDVLLKMKKTKLIEEQPKVAKTSEGIIYPLYMDSEIIDYIILPLYSPKLDDVAEKSGLNQWNALGRKRNLDEVYIPIPSWIHKVKSNFFKEYYNTEDNKTESFEVKLPNKRILSMKIAQDGGKALMSNPNSDLGEWILRDVLKLPKKTLVTKKMLDIIGIDSVMLSKTKNNVFNLDFLKSGSYEIFEEENNLK